MDQWRKINMYYVRWPRWTFILQPLVLHFILQPSTSYFKNLLHTSKTYFILQKPTSYFNRLLRTSTAFFVLQPPTSYCKSHIQTPDSTLSCSVSYTELKQHALSKYFLPKHQQKHNYKMYFNKSHKNYTYMLTETK